MKPTELLKCEHRVIEQVLDCLERIAANCSAEGRLDGDAARQTVSFFREFADRCHHGKEENQLFPLMEARGFPSDGGPVGVMRIEHEQGRRMIRGMGESIAGAAEGDPQACRVYLKNAHEYMEMLREHIKKEDDCLFPMADGALSVSDQASLQDLFEKVDREEIGREHHRKYLRLAEELAERFGVAKHGLVFGPGVERGSG